jgi:hypothetical protein
VTSGAFFLVGGDDLLVVGIREAGARGLQLPRAIGRVAATGAPTVVVVAATATSHQHGERGPNEDEPREHLAVHLRVLLH